jgi:thioredoxin 1
MSSDLIKHVTDASFEADVLKSGKPVLVDYWAEWCGPCKAIAPILDELSTQYGEKLQIAKMNVDENSEVPGKLGIRGIPTLMRRPSSRPFSTLTYNRLVVGRIARPQNSHRGARRPPQP